MVLAFRDNQGAALPIPAGAMFEMLGAAEDDRFDVVCVEGEEFLIFDTDLKQHAERIAEPELMCR